MSKKWLVYATDSENYAVITADDVLCNNMVAKFADDLKDAEGRLYDTETVAIFPLARIHSILQVTGGMEDRIKVFGNE